MANVIKETYLGQVQQNGGGANSSLDKLAQLGKRAARKFIQKPIIEALIEITEKQKDAKTRKGTPWIKQFSNILNCSSILKSTGDKVTARYCNSRACLICSAIRTGKLWNKYEDALKRTKEPFFVTLTQGPRVDAMELRETIAQMTNGFQKCIGVLKKRKKNLVGFRKLEITYETKGKHKNTYHPHFHCLVDGEEEAYWLVSEWLKRNPGASVKAQDVRKWEAGDLNEVFKYITKFFDKDGKPISPIAMYNIVVAMDGIRSFQTFGNFAKGTQESDDVNKELTSQETTVPKGNFEWNYGNWFKQYKGSFVPIMENVLTEKMNKHYKNLMLCLNVKTAEEHFLP